MYRSCLSTELFKVSIECCYHLQLMPQISYPHKSELMQLHITRKTHDRYLNIFTMSQFFFLCMRLRPIIGQPGNTSIISRVKLGQTTVQLGKRAGFDDVGHRLGLTTGAQVRCQVFLQVPQCPSKELKRVG